MDSARLGPDARRAALARMPGETFDVVVVGGGVTGLGCAAGRGDARPLRRADRAARLGRRHLEPLEQADPRRPPLPGAAELRPGARGARASARCCSAGCAPTSCDRCRFLYPLRHRAWERAYVGAGVALYDALATRGGSEPAGRCRATATSPGAAVSSSHRVCAGTPSSAASSTSTPRSTTRATPWPLARTAARHGAALATQRARDRPAARGRPRRRRARGRACESGGELRRARRARS